VLVELKYGHRPPDWMEALIRTLAPTRVSFSKYAAAMTSRVVQTLMTPGIASDAFGCGQTLGGRS